MTTRLSPCECGGARYLLGYLDHLSGRAVKFVGCVKCRAVPFSAACEIDSGRPGWAQMIAAAQRAPVRWTAGAGPGHIPLVSVVMPSYNHARYIRDVVASIESQAVDLELIVIDDGSSDTTPDVLRELAEESDRGFRVVHTTNQGAGPALNLGLTMVLGHYVALANSDDCYSPDRLRQMIYALEVTGAPLAFSGSVLVDRFGFPTEPGAEHQLLERQARALKARHPLYTLIEANAAMSTGNFVFRRTLVEKIGGFSRFKILHDWDFLLASTYEGAPCFVPKPLYFYRKHDENTSANSRVISEFERESMRKRFFADFERHPLANDADFRKHINKLGLSEFMPAWVH